MLPLLLTLQWPRTKDVPLILTLQWPLTKDASLNTNITMATY